MSDTQTVVDVIISGSTATVVDTRIDGVTTVAGAAPVTNVSGQVPDLGVNTDILATEGDILSLTNDVANLRANLIVTGNTLTDEIGALSGELISTGNNLEFKISNLSGDLIASGNNLDSLRDILSGNLITTGQTLTADLNTLSGNLNSRILSTGEVVDDISGNLITTGQTLTNLIGGNDTDILQLKTATGELQDKKFDKTGGTISGSILPNQSGTLSLGSEALPFLSAHFKDLTVSNNTLFIGDVPIHSSNGGIDFRSATGVTEFQDVSIRNLTVTGTEVIIDVEHLGVKDNTIVINSGEQGAGITAGSGGIVIDRGTLPDADIIFNEANDRFEIDFPLSVENSLVVKRNETGHFAESSNLVQTGQTLTSSIASSDSSINTISGNLVTTGQTLQTQITSNDNDISTLTSNIVTTGQTLQTQITSNDSDISTLSSNLVTTGQTLTSEIASVSGLISGSDNANSRIDTLSGNVIETGQYLEDEILVLSGIDNQTIADLIATGQTLTAADNTLANNLYITGNRNEQIIKQTGDTLSEEVATVSGLITSNDGDIAQLKTATGVLKTTTETNASNLVSTGQYLTSQISIVSGIAGGTDITTLSGRVDTLSGNLITTGQTLQTQITSNDSDISTLTSNLITTGQTLTSEIAIVSGLTTGSSSDPELSGKVDTLSGNLITTGQTLQTQITSNDSDISTLTSNLITTGQTLTSEIAIVSGIAENASDEALSGKVDTLSGNLITTGQTLQTQITSNDSDITSLTSNLVTTGQTLTTDITTVSGLIVDNDGDITALKSATGVLKTSTDSNASNLITTGQTLQAQITSNDGDISTLTTNLGTTGQTLQTQITSNDSDISTLTSNLITTGQTLTTDIGTVSGLITDNDADITALKSATGVLKTSTDANTTNLITTGQTLQTQITSNDGDITTLTSNLVTTGQTLQTQITSNDSDISTLTTNIGTTGQTLQTQITSNDSDISTLTSNLVTTGQTLTTNINTVATNLGTSGQTLQTQITSNDSDISTLTSNLRTTGQTLQTQITSNDSDIASLTTNVGTTGQTLQTQITSNDSDISTLDSTTVKLTTNQSIAGNKIFTNDVTINNLTVTGTEVIVDVENLAVKDNIIQINSGESGAGISAISGGIVIDRGTATNANILYNDANDRFELNFPLAVEGEVVASASNLITTGQTLTTNINTVSTNLGTSGQTLQTQITSNDSDISTLTTNLGTTGQTLQTQITSNDSDISTLTSNLATTGQTLQTQITSNDSDISTLTTNLGTTGQTLQTQITSNDSDISTLTSNLVTTGQTLTTNINTVSTNLGTSGQTLQTQITSNDTDITNLSSNLVTTGQTLTTNINTVATNLVTTGQTLTSEIATVSGLIPATVIDGGGTANKVPLWSDANTIGDSVISQSNGKIGIGDATPDFKLDVAGAGRFAGDNSATPLTVNGGTATLASIQLNGGTNAVDNSSIQAKYSLVLASNSTNGISNRSILFKNGTTEQMRISADGAVGINTTSPNASSKLHVYGWTIIESATNFASLRLKSTTGSWDIDNNNGTFGLQWAGGDKFNITSAGSVGIGTNTPARKLHVVGDYIRNESSAGSGVYSQMDGDGFTIYRSSANCYLNFPASGSSLVVRGPSYAEFIRVNSSGNVGIGTNGPEAPLHILGGYNANNPKTLIIAGREDSSAVYGGIQFEQAGGNTFFGIGNDSRADRDEILIGGGFGSATNATALRVFTGTYDSSVGTERLTILSGGSVGIGTNTPSRKFMIFGGSARMGIKNSTEGVVLGLLSDDAGYLHLNNGSGTNTIQLRGDTVSYFNAGSVGIGTNAPDTKLHIEGTTKTSATIESTGNHAELIIKSENNTYSPYVVFKDAGADRYFIQANPSDSLLFRPQGTGTTSKWVVFNSNGSVGIGTQTPGAKLHVNGYARIGNPHANEDQASTLILSNSTGGSATHDFLTLADTANNGSETGRIVFKARYGTGSFSAGQEATFISSIRNGTSGAYHLAFGTTNDSSADAVERVRISSLGNVGIGTNNPGYKLDVNGTAHITTAQDSVAPLTLKSTYNGSTAGPLLDLYRKSGTPADGDNLGTITFTADTNVGSINEFARIESTALDVTDTTEDGALKLAVVTAGTSRSRVYMDSTETVFNDASQDFDFRVESDNSSHALFVRGSDSAVGIGTDTPSSKLHVNSEISCGADDNNRAMFGYTPSRFYLGTRQSGTNYLNTVNVTSGNVGIGGIDPDQKLEVWGAIKSSGAYGFYAGRQDGTWSSFGTGVPTILLRGTANNSRAGAIHFQEYDGNTTSAIYSTDGTDGYGLVLSAYQGDIKFATGSLTGNKMVILGSGSVGIGTTAPADTLHVYGTGTTSIFESSSANSYISIKEASGGNHVYLGNQSGLFVIQTPGSSYSTKFQVTSAGLVGIGVSPTTRLQVKDSVDNSYESGISIVRSADGATTWLNVRGGATNFNNKNHAGNAGLPYIWFQNGTQRLKIESDGQATFAGAIALSTNTTPSTSGGEAFLYKHSSNGTVLSGYNASIETGSAGSRSVRLAISNTGATTFNSAFTFPTTDGSANQVLQTDGSGTVTWATVSGGGGGGGVSGSGTDNYIPRWNGTTALENSILYDTGSTLSVGTTSPNAVGGTSVLYLSGQSNMIVMSSSNVSNNSSYIRHWGTAHFQWQTYNGSNAGYIELQPYGGQVAIGMRGTTTTYNLHIGAFGADDVNTFRIDGTNGSSETAAFVIENDGANGKVNFKHNIGNGTPATKLTLDHNGNLGIGTVSPPHKLSIYGTGAGKATVQIEGEGGADPYINFLVNNTTHWAVGADDSASDSFKISQHSALGTNDRITIASDGDVDIAQRLGVGGAHSDVYKLLVNGSSRFDDSMYFSSVGQITWSASEFKLRGESGKALNLGAGGSFGYVVIATDGNVGIGTATPDGVLNVKSSGDGVNVLDLVDSSGDALFNVRQSGNNGMMRLYADGGAEKIRLRSSGPSFFTGGSVGIGTNAPVNLFHISGADESTLMLQANTGSTGDKCHIGFGCSTVMLSGTNMGAKITFERLGASTGGDLSFHTRPVGGTLTQRFVLRSDGNVGVGTNAPATKLQVAGNLNLETSGGDVGLWLHRTDAREYRLYVDSNGLLNLRDQDAGATRMAFKTDGNLGIATTTPGAKLHVNGDAIFENNGSNINIKNTWSSGNHDINFIGGSSSGGSANNTAARIRCLATAPGGAATGSLTFTVNSGDTFVDALYIKEDGKIGIGTNAPASKLQVSTTNAVSVLTIHRDGSNVTTTNTSLGRIQFAQDYDAGQQNWGHIEFVTTATSPYRTNIDFHVKSTSGNVMRAMTINGTDSSGPRVGVGTHAPVKKLDVRAAESWDGIHIGSTAGSATAIDFARSTTHANPTARIGVAEPGATHTSDMRFFTSDASGGAPNLVEKMRIDPNGNVGIGTNAPSEMLHINKSSGTGSFIRFQDTGGGGVYIGARSNVMELYAGGAERMRIAADGKVGIGTNAPVDLLHLYSATPSIILDKTETGWASLRFYKAGSQVSYIQLDGSEEMVYYQPSGLGHLFYAGGVAALKIQSDGKIGIGTASPDSKLEIVGGGWNSSLKIKSAGSETGIQFEDSDGNTDGYIYAINGNVGFLDAGGSWMVQCKNDDYIRFAVTSNTEHMRINAAGKVIINDTATTNNNNARLYVNGPVYGSEFDLPSGGVIDWANGDARIAEGLSSNYSLSLQNYDGSSAMVTTMFLKSGGNVGIGTVDPAGRLHVYTGSAGSTTPNTNHDDLTIESSGNAGLQLFTPDANYQYVAFGSPAGANRGYVRYGHNEEEMVLRAATVDILKIKSTGVGIGTTPNSSAKLESYITSGGEKGLRLNSNFSGGNAVDFIPAIVGVSNAGFSIDLAGTNRFTINSSGNVGIGTNNGVQKLHLQSATCIVRVVSTTANANASIWFNSNVGGTNADRWEIGTNISAGSSLEIYDRLNGASRMVVKNDGNVGIGTNAPLDKLDVYGSGAVFRNLSDNADSVQIVRGTNHTASPDAKFYIYDNSSADWAAKINLDGASYGLDIQNGSDFFLLCRKAGGDRLLEVHGSQTIVNGGGIDYDFRVESNNDDYLLFTEGSTDRVAISTTAPAAKLHVEGDFKVGTTNNGNWMGYKDVSLNGNTYTTALTINLNNHTGCYVKLFLSGDWSSHSAVAFVGEYFVQNGSDGYAEPGTVISEFDNTNTDSIESKIVDPSSDTFTIQLKLSTAANGTLAGKLSYHVMGMATAVS